MHTREDWDIAHAIVGHPALAEQITATLAAISQAIAEDNGTMCAYLREELAQHIAQARQLRTTMTPLED